MVFLQSLVYTTFVASNVELQSHSSAPPSPGERSSFPTNSSGYVLFLLRSTVCLPCLGWGIIFAHFSGALSWKKMYYMVLPWSYSSQSAVLLTSSKRTPIRPIPKKHWNLLSRYASRDINNAYRHIYYLYSYIHIINAIIENSNQTSTWHHTNPSVVFLITSFLNSLCSPLELEAGVPPWHFIDVSHRCHCWSLMNTSYITSDLDRI